jgi:hypothetical protein
MSVETALRVPVLDEAESSAPVLSLVTLKRHWTDGLVRCWWCCHWKEREGVCCTVESKLNI